MSDTKSKLLAETLTDVLERMAFISPLPLDADAPAPAQAWKASMPLGGAVSGSVELIAPQTFAATLAGNMLGEVTPEEALARAADSLKELVNVVCGAFAARLAETTGAIEIGLPSLTDMRSPDDWKVAVAAPGTTVIDAEGSVLAVRLTLGPNARV